MGFGARLLARLDEEFPRPKTALHYATPLELLVATILSAQCTDERVNQVTKTLFARYRSAQDFARAEREELERLIRSTGFYKAKAKNLIECGRALVDRFGGQVPRTMEELVTLAGVGRKTANVVLGNCFGIPSIVVDTHVRRVSQRLGLVATDDPDKIELELQKVFPRKRWTQGSHQLLLHGRHICTARSPQCPECALNPMCRWGGKRSA